MHDLHKEQKLLRKALEENFRGPQKSLFHIYFYWWRFYLLMNKNLEQSSNDHAKRAIIQDFIEFQKQCQKDAQEIQEHVLSQVTEGQSVEVNEPTLPEHIRSIKEMYLQEVQKFNCFAKELKKTSGKKRKNISHKKWI